MNTQLDTTRLERRSNGRRSFHVGCWPWSTTNPYQQLFYDALRPIGVHVRTDVEIHDPWLRRETRKLDAIHFHWPEEIWRTRGRGWLGRVHGVVGFDRFLRLARRLGIQLIWTVHNLENHEQADWIDRRGYRCLARHCDLLICHSRSAAERVARRDSPRGQIVVMEHGNYAGIYPEPRPREDVLRELGLRTGLPLVCCLGLMRGYKGLDVAVRAVARLKGGVQLVIGGDPHPQFDAPALRALVSKTPNVALIERSLTDREFADFVGASEAVLLPYRTVTGSGALLAAWTIGRGVVASDLPFFREVAAPEPDAATLVPAEDAVALAGAIESYLRIPSERRHGAARRLADRYSWDRCVRPVADVLLAWMNREAYASPTGPGGRLKMLSASG